MRLPPSPPPTVPTMDDVTIRIAAPAEHARVQAAYDEWGYGGGVLPTDVVYVAERGTDLVGIVRRTVEHGVTMLRGMHVAPARQRRGIGRRLLHALVADLGGAECHCVPHAHLVRFYGAGGFERVPEEQGPPFLRERIAGYRARGLSVLLMRRPPS